MFKNLVIPAFLALSCTQAEKSYSFGKPTQTKVIESSKLDNDKLTLSLKVENIHNKVNQFSYEGTPWKLKIKKAEGVSFAKKQYDEKDLDKSMPGYSITSEKGAKKHGKIEYSLVAFVCTKDKTRCYREAHKKTLEW